MRWLPALSMMLVSIISYIDRNTLALLAPTLLSETHLSNQQYGFIVSAFSVAYMVGNPLWGKILDRVGVRAGMSAAVSLWTLASVSHAFASGFPGFAAARAVLGFGEGATFPGGLRTAVQTLPPQLRSRGTAVAYSGGSFGAIITPIVITPVVVLWGWRGAFWFTGTMGVVWLALWAILGRRRELSPAPEPEPSGTSFPWKDARVWAFVAAYALGAFPTGFVIYQASIYLSAALHMSQIEIGRVLWIPPLGWELGYFFWGWVTDRFARAGASLSAMRGLFIIAMWLSLPLALVPRAGSMALTLAMLCFAMFVSAGFIIGSVAYATSQFSGRHSGLIAGLGAGSWSAGVALVMPGIGRLFDQQEYETAFVIAGVFPIAGYLIWRILSHRFSTHFST